MSAVTFSNLQLGVPTEAPTPNLRAQTTATIHSQLGAAYRTIPKDSLTKKPP